MSNSEKMTKKEIYEHWVGMPEYNNIEEPEPVIEAKFKFRNKEDFALFNALLKEHVFQCSKVFDGIQRKDKKQAWFPLKEKASKYVYK